MGFKSYASFFSQRYSAYLIILCCFMHILHMLLTLESTAGCIAFHHIVQAVQWNPAFFSNTKFNNSWKYTKSSVQHSSFICCLCVIDISVCVCVFFNICLSYLLWLKILIVELLLPIGRHLIKRDHTAGCLASFQRKLPFSSSPSLGRNPTSLSNYFIIYLTEKLHLEHGRHNKRKRKNRVMRSRSVGIQDQQGKKSIVERFLSKGFFFTLSLSVFFYLISCQTSPAKLARGSRCQRVNHSDIDLIM